MSRIQMAVVVLTAVVPGAAGIVSALECEGRLVSMGASPWDVQAICGTPTQMNDTVELVLKPVYDPHGHVAGCNFSYSVGAIFPHYVAEGYC